MGEQDRDQGAGSGGVAAGAAGGVPVGLVRGGEHAAGFRLCQGGRSGQRTGLGLEDLEVVIESQDLDVTSDCTFVASDKRWPVMDFDGPCGQTDG